MSLKEAAIELARRGWWIFPLQVRGKTPLTKRGFHAATNIVAQVDRWWSGLPNANIGLVPGRSGLLVIDIDGADAERRAIELGIDLNSTLAVRTGRPDGGIHLYFRKPNLEIGNRSIARGIDVRCDKGYVVVPPSIHPTGTAYAWVDRPLSDFPDNLLPLLTQERSSTPAANVGVNLETGSGKIGAGGRNSMLTSFAGGLRRYGADEFQLLVSLRAVNDQMCDPPLAERELASIARSIARYSVEPLRLANESMNDVGNARRLAILFGENLRFAAGLGWLWWDGSRWVRAVRGEEEQAAKATARAIQDEAALVPDLKLRSALMRWSSISQNASKLRAMLEVAESESEVRLTAEDFDSDPDTLCVPNGVIDTRTGRFSPPSREVLCTMRCGVPFDPTARAPRWEEFIGRIANGDAEFIAYIQRALGYALTGSTREQCFFVLYGTGANGKSTLLETVMYVMGDYATAADFSLLTTKPAGGASEGLARLRGKRLVTAVESEEGVRFNETLLKQLTGGDTITARYLYQSSFSFKPSFKVIVATNYKPRIGGTDEGIWRRVRLLPLTVQIPLKERDTTLFERLTAEGSGILNWLLRGAVAWRTSELGDSRAVGAATAEYRGEQDAVGAFINELCELGADYTVPANALYQRFVEFCEENDQNPLSREKFGRALNRQGLTRARSSLGEYFRRGLRLREAI